MNIKWMFLIERISLDGEILRSWVDPIPESCLRYVNYDRVEIKKDKWEKFLQQIENTSPQDCKAITILIKGNLGNVKVSAVPIKLAGGESLTLNGYLDIPIKEEGVSK